VPNEIIGHKSSVRKERKIEIL